jgi:nitrite reductase/ring-hydroxylating ferredoxin subunit
MVRGQTVAQAHCQIERLLVVHRFECSFHAYQYTMTDGECLFLSDKLLELTVTGISGKAVPARVI